VSAIATGPIQISKAINGTAARTDDRYPTEGKRTVDACGVMPPLVGSITLAAANAIRMRREWHRYPGRIGLRIVRNRPAPLATYSHLAGGVARRASHRDGGKAPRARAGGTARTIHKRLRATSLTTPSRWITARTVGA